MTVFHIPRNQVKNNNFGTNFETDCCGTLGILDIVDRDETLTFLFD